MINKILSYALAPITALSFCACGKSANTEALNVKPTTQQYTSVRNFTQKQVAAFKGIERLMSIPENQHQSSEAGNRMARQKTAERMLYGLALQFKQGVYDTSGNISISGHVSFEELQEAKEELREIRPYVADLHSGNADGTATPQEVASFRQTNPHINF